MTSFQRLQERIKKELDIDAYNFNRLYPGYWQRKGGAFVWTAQVKEWSNDIGSTYTVKRLLKAPKLYINNSGHIAPDE